MSHEIIKNIFVTADRRVIVCHAPGNIQPQIFQRCADCGFVYYFNSSAATVAFILNDKNELLVYNIMVVKNAKGREILLAMVGAVHENKGARQIRRRDRQLQRMLELIFHY